MSERSLNFKSFLLHDQIAFSEKFTLKNGFTLCLLLCPEKKAEAGWAIKY